MIGFRVVSPPHHSTGAFPKPGSGMDNSIAGTNLLLGPSPSCRRAVGDEYPEGKLWHRQDHTWKTRESGKSPSRPYARFAVSANLLELVRFGCMPFCFEVRKTVYEVQVNGTIRVRAHISSGTRRADTQNKAFPIVFGRGSSHSIHPFV